VTKLENSEERKNDFSKDEFYGIKILKPNNPERGFFKLTDEEIRFYSNGERPPKGYFI